MLVLEHDPEGTLGVVLDRPSDVEVAELLPTWAGLLSAPTAMFTGGPVQREAVVAVARRATGAPAEIDGYRPITDTLGVVDLTGDPALLAAHLTGMRCFAGYAGWTSGQLVAEIRAGAWWVVDGIDDDVLGREPDGLWRRVLRRQPGERAWFATYPADPVVN